MVLRKQSITALASFLVSVFSPQFSLSQTTNPQIMSIWKGHIDAGTTAEKQRNYTSAEKFFSLAVNEAEKFDQEGKYTVMSCRLLADVYEQEEKYANAEPLRRKALAITEKALGPNSPIGEFNKLIASKTITQRLLSPNLTKFVIRLCALAAQAFFLYRHILSNNYALNPKYPRLAVS